MTKENKDIKTETPLNQSAFQRFVMWACVALAMVSVIAGRVKTFHMTEGEAFIYGWKYWVATIAFSFGAGLIIKRHT